jgi:MYXO-CTERM domain-containing protein
MTNITGKGALATGGLADDGTGTLTEVAISEIFDTTLGAPCGSGCPSGTFCTEGVCCESASCPEGQTCAAPGHEGVCAKPKGATCSTGAECSTGYCAESVCCDAPCNAECQSCTVAGKVGTCTAATPGTDPGGKCAASFGGGDPICGPFCDSTGFCGTYAATGTLCGASADAGPDSGPFCTRNECDDFGGCMPSTYNCGLTCTTTVTCDEATKSCTPTVGGIKAGYCVIDNNCWTYGDIDPTDTTHCRTCNPPVSKTTWFDSCSETGTDTGTSDTGTTDAKVDTGTDAKVDSGTDTKVDAHDAAPDTSVAADSTVADSGSGDNSLPETSTCSCRVPGGDEGAGRSTSGALVAIAGIALIAARRRRR